MNWQILSASVIGSSHERSGLPCQDAHQVRVLPGGEILCAVADGLGSAALAEVGAQLAVKLALDLLSAQFSTLLQSVESDRESIIRQIFADTRCALEEKATLENRPLHDYATTLMIAVVQDECLSVAHLGDGAVVAQIKDAPLFTLSVPQRGEYANETMPLTSPNALESVRYHSQVGKVEAVALFTDGLQNLCLDATNGEPFEPFFVPLFAQLQTPLPGDESQTALANFLQSERICKRTDDDKTLVLMKKLGLARDTIRNKNEPARLDRFANSKQ